MAVPATTIDLKLMMTGNQEKYQINRHFNLDKIDNKSNITEPNAKISKILELTNLYDIKLAKIKK